MVIPLLVASAIVGLSTRSRVSAQAQKGQAAPAKNKVYAHVIAVQNLLLAQQAAAVGLPQGALVPPGLRKRAFEQAVQQVANTRIPPNFLQLAKERQAKVQGKALTKTKKVAGADPKAKSFDWRTLKKVTPVRTYMGNTGQDSCGCCWCFAGIAAFESSSLILGAGSPSTLDASEQLILDCGKTGGCNGDWYWTAWRYMEAHGTSTEADVPYKGYVDEPECAAKSGVARPYKVQDFNLVSASEPIPKAAEIKKSLCDHGPLAVAVYADDAFVDYPAAGQVFKGFPSSPSDPSAPINHAVTLIGWDDARSAWLIKNSWGSAWGVEGGYMWIDYSSNNIGFAAGWVTAKVGP